MRSRTRGLAAVLATAAAISMSGVASAAPPEHGDFHDEFSDLVSDFCDSPGLEVQIDGVVDGTFLVNQHGSGGLVYFLDHVHVSVVLTNVATGNVVTTEERTVSKDLHVVDNGDGTLTITDLATGNFVIYGEDGKAIARNPGQVRFQFIVDHGGTPTDPNDDVLVEDFGLVKGSTGRNDDFCTAVVAALT